MRHDLVLYDHYYNKDVQVLEGTPVKLAALMTRQRPTCRGAFYVGVLPKG